MLGETSKPASPAAPAIARVFAKTVVLLVGWAIATLAPLLGVALWASYGGHLNTSEITVVLFGHVLNAGLTIALAFAAARSTQRAVWLGGLLVAPNISAHYLMGVPLAIQGFTALVIGGVGRVEGALLGGLLLAFAEQLTARYAPIPSGYTQGVPLLFLMIFLLVRPTGLLRARA